MHGIEELGDIYKVEVIDVVTGVGVELAFLLRHVGNGDLVEAIQYGEPKFNRERIPFHSGEISSRVKGEAEKKALVEASIRLATKREEAESLSSAGTLQEIER